MHGTELARLAEAKSLALNFEAAVGRRHSDREDACAKASAGNQVTRDVRHPQRHLQLYLDRDEE